MNVVVFIVLMVSGQILFKAASQRVSNSNSIAELIINSTREWKFLVALAAYAAGTLVWMRILKQMPLSMAYPLAMGSTIALTFLASHYVFGETLTPGNAIGVAAIVGGIILVCHK